MTAGGTVGGTAAAESALPHGTTLAELHRLARLAAGTINVAHGSAADRCQLAWAAIADALLAADTPPDPRRLVWAGRTAIYRAARDDWHHWGVSKRDPLAGVGSMRAFRVFWWPQVSPDPGPEGPVVERAAVAQIWPTLTDAQRQALLALATTGNYRAAAALLGISYQSLKDRLCAARRRFRRLWHEGETPSRPWGTDRRVGAYTQAPTPTP